MNTRVGALDLIAWGVLALSSAVVIIGLVATLVPYIGAADPIALTHQMVTQSATLPSLFASIRIALIAQIVSVGAALLIVQYGMDKAMPRTQTRGLPLMLATPHVAFALGLIYLLSPSGWIVRALSPWLTGFERPPDWLIINDQFGWSMIIALVAKETPFLVLMSWSALRHIPHRDWRIQASGIGINTTTVWWSITAPRLLLALRFPMIAVLAYSLSVVDLALVIGPSRPPVFAVTVYQWFTDADLSMRPLAAAGASVLLFIMLVLIVAWLWVCALFSQWLTSRAVHGWRARSAHYICARSIRYIGATLYLGAVGLLVVWSFARGWRFPALFPQDGHMSAWLSLPLKAVVIDTMIVALISAAFAVIAAVIVLEYQVQRQRRFRTEWICIALFVPQIAVLIGIYRLALAANIDVGWLLVIVGHYAFVFPYVYLALEGGYRSFDQRLYTQGLTLGISPLRLWFSGKWPLVRATIIAAFAVGLATSILQYLPTVILGGGRVSGVTVKAVSSAGGFDRNIAATWALVQTLLAAIGFLLAQRALTQPIEQKHHA